MKTILMIGTAHEFQELSDKNPWETEFSELLASLVKTYDIQVLLEEWNRSRGTAIGETLAEDNLSWQNIGTPPNSPEYDTSRAGLINFDPDRSTHLMPRRYPFEIQEKREIYMLDRITESMTRFDRGLLVVGMNHLHSLTLKLRLAGFEVTCCNWLQICDKGTMTIQKRCPTQLVAATR